MALLLPLCSVFVTSRCSAAEPEPAVNAEENVPLRRIEEAAVKIGGETGVEGDLFEIVSPVLKGKPILSQLLGASVTIALPKPLPLRYLAIPRVGWDDWATPGEVAISINGKPCGLFHLSAPVIHPSASTEPQTVDVIDLGEVKSASEIEVEVLTAAPLTGKNKHGTLRVLLPKR